MRYYVAVGLSTATGPRCGRWGARTALSRLLGARPHASLASSSHACIDERLTITFVGGNLPNLLKAMAASKEIAPWLSSSSTLLAESPYALRSLFRKAGAGRSAQTQSADGYTGRDGMLRRAGFISATIAAGVHPGGFQSAASHLAYVTNWVTQMAPV